MLKVIGKVDCIGEEFFFDEYVPISYFCESGYSSVPLYWRTGNFKTSLLEIGIDSKKGNLEKVVLTLFDEISYLDYYFNVSLASFEKGVPVFEMWSDGEGGGRFKDEIGPLNIFVSNNSICLIFAKDNPTRILETSNVYFYINDRDYLIGIRFFSLSDSDLSYFFKVKSDQ